MKRRGATRATCVDEVGVSLPRGISGKVILVISGPGRMMYQSLEPEPEGAIFSKEVSASGGLQHSSRRWRQYGKLAGNKHTRHCWQCTRLSGHNCACPRLADLGLADLGQIPRFAEHAVI